MCRCNRKVIYNNGGFTLVELVLVIPLISIVFILGYNMLFLTTRSFTEVNQSFDVSEELRIFQININKEANSAKKAEETKDVLHRISSTEIYIYTDVNNAGGKNIPEIVRYRLVDGNLQRDVKNPTGDVYPYTYPSAFGAAEIVVRNVKNTDIFSPQESIREISEYSQEAKDYRMKMRMKLIIYAEPNDIEVQGYLVTKSRTQAE